MEIIIIIIITIIRINKIELKPTENPLSSSLFTAEKPLLTLWQSRRTPSLYDYRYST